MSNLALGRLDWLPAPPVDFRKIVKAIQGEGKDVPASRLIELALHDLDLNKLIALDRLTGTASVAGRELAPVRLAILSQATTDYAAPAIRATALRHRLKLDTYVPAYGQAMAEIMTPDSGLARFGAEIALIAETGQSLGLVRPFADPTRGREATEAALRHVAAMVEGLQAKGVGAVILQTLPIPADPWCGSYDRRAPGSVTAQIEAFNRGLVKLADDFAATIFDVDALAGLVGRANWFDASLWHRAKLPFALDHLPLYAEQFAHVLRALRGKSCKCLVLDLDNTCWGGVIGDDGLDGIRIGQGSPEGEAYLDIQNYALALRERGVVLAVCSKNEESAAKSPFEKHPDMALRLDDIAVFVANWTDKASNLAHIAKVLNIGLDALVFLDDNPAERARVRQMLPQVAVPELGEDPATYPAAVAQAGYFETVGLSADDANRAAQYRANADRAVALETIGDYDAYLRSLEMTCAIRPFDEVGRTRIAQLINKSNQFNLTTRRYTEAEVAAMQADPDVITLQVRLTDKFGDNGMISVVILRAEDDAWICDTWLMSCRVLKRRVEEAVLATIADAACIAGVKTIRGDYIPSEKNALVEEHFKMLGFSRSGPIGENGTRWKMDVASHRSPELPMIVDAQPEDLIAAKISA